MYITDCDHQIVVYSPSSCINEAQCGMGPNLVIAVRVLTFMHSFAQADLGLCYFEMTQPEVDKPSLIACSLIES